MLILLTPAWVHITDDENSALTLLLSSPCGPKIHTDPTEHPQLPLPWATYPFRFSSISSMLCSLHINTYTVVTVCLLSTWMLYLHHQDFQQKLKTCSIRWFYVHFKLIHFVNFNELLSISWTMTVFEILLWHFG